MFAGVLTIALIAGFIYLATESYNGLPFLSYRDVYVSLPNIGHLEQHDQVEIAGADVGQVLRTSTRNNKALVELQLSGGTGAVPENSTVIVRADGLLGERYVELVPGNSKKKLPQNGTIVESNANATYYNGVPETLNLFNAPTRGALGEMMRGLGEGLDGRGSQLNQTIQVGPQSGANFDTAAYAVLARGDYGTAASNFLPFLNSGLTALNESRQQITNLFDPAASALQPLITERNPTETAVSLFPSAIPSITYGFYNPLRGTGSAGIAIARALAPVVPKISGELQSATRLLQDTPASLREVKTVLNQVPTAVPAGLDVLNALKPDLTPLKNGLTNLTDPVTSLAEHGCDIQSLAYGVDSLVNYGSLPGTAFGPNVGFPLTAIISPQDGIADEAHVGTLDHTNVLDPPCLYSPGSTLSTNSLLQVLSGLLGS
jgi:ABC-type transporter Mla subunit MlaD